MPRKLTERETIVRNLDAWGVQVDRLLKMAPNASNKDLKELHSRLVRLRGAKTL